MLFSDSSGSFKWQQLTNDKDVIHYQQYGIRFAPQIPTFVGMPVNVYLTRLSKFTSLYNYNATQSAL